jgi:hypothetical protein
MILELLLSIIEILIKYRFWGFVLVLIIGGVYILIFFIRILADEDYYAIQRGRYFKILFKIRRKSDDEKKYIENDINGRINLARRSMPFGVDHLPRSLKVEWIESAKGESAIIRNNEIIVRLDPSESQEKNTVLLANALVKKTSLIGVRHLIREPLEIPIDLNLIRNLLIETKDKRILDWFFRNEYEVALDKSEEIRLWNGKIVEIEERGLFTRLLLVELDNYAKKVSGRPYSKELYDEIKEFINFLNNIATKISGQNVPLVYSSRNMKIGVILVGKTSSILLEGIEPYLNAFAYHMKNQLDSIFVIQWDKELLGTTDKKAYEEFVALTKQLDKEIENRF